MQHQHKTVLVTGGGGGIGRVTALTFSQRGYRLAICDIDAGAARDTAQLIREGGGIASWHEADISQSEQVQRLLREVIREHGKLDVAFNNAGVSGGRVPLAEIEEDDFDRCLHTNLKGTWLCMKYQIRQMLEQGGGVIVNNCSINGINGSVGASYCSTKHGVAGLTKSAALAYARRNIRVNAVCPGLIDAGLGAKLIQKFADQPAALTAAIPVGHVGSAEDVAEAVLWLSSDAARFTHGHLLLVDGGYSVH
ncbi:NAD(P)-dependent dehydrogenase, short-chain alcohol dehydrogenase family [Solimonas aquatica]|uniref:NAD(P)-dependent dehydrogenase, short-chain alcohol dehydrogenase family n=1 Tax=Solimonas aquatica TaxID=489703 RepID=A0A1H9EM09_9GAMM|nr:SDR family oxidoreductase [Solimonas aquatica]SEQ26776.1 NAD(P)-dependent dehydrogenase, short-chain alcohol dehydrogenase family [Solimonas aquatica]